MKTTLQKPTRKTAPPLAASACALLASLLCHNASLAQNTTPAPAQGAAASPTAPQATSSTPTFTINGFDITGENPLSAPDSAAVLAPFIGPGATIDTLQKATAALEAALKAQGFALHRVALPPQEVGKNVVLNIVKFVIGKISVQGQSNYSEANIRASVPELLEGQAPNFSALAVQTTIANENQGKQIKVSLKESEEADKIDAVVQVKENKPWNFSASLANTGSSATGQDRLALVGGHSNLFDLDHQFSGAYTTSVERISDVKQLGLNYRLPLYRRGATLGLSYTQSDVVGNFGTFNSTGAGSTMGINYSHYLAPVGGRRTNIAISLDEKRFNATQVNGLPVLGQLSRSSRPLSLSYAARIESDTAIWGYNTDLVFNLPGASGNNLAAYQSEDPRITEVNAQIFRAGVNYLSSFAGGWLGSVRTQLQYSGQALISGEQFGIGGSTSVRGTGERMLAGDSGMFASIEVTSPALMEGLQALGFIDTGWLKNQYSILNPNKPASDRLQSVGLGLRYGTGDYSASLDWARLVTGSVLPWVAGSTIPQKGDSKVHVNLSARF